jgi:hypothetical protein
MTKLQDFDFIIKHVTGTSNIPADVLSRLNREEKGPRTTDTLLPDRLFVNFLLGKEVKEPEEEDQNRKGKIISENHDTPTAGHPGIKRMLSLLSRKEHSWKGIRKDMKDYMDRCQVCQKTSQGRDQAMENFTPSQSQACLGKSCRGT